MGREISEAYLMILFWNLPRHTQEKIVKNLSQYLEALRERFEAIIFQTYSRCFNQYIPMLLVILSFKDI